ncbi:MAG: hypothetical protein GY797_00660 [Deltaproteobacteria bacterium]|nr:hypothetical protein [Deltaproteobacteria bacterium]
MEKPEVLFDRWFVQPLNKLEAIPNGDGGFIALATSCFLYERFAVATINKSGGEADRPRKIEKFMEDFNTDRGTAEAFWSVVRDGILHQGMPKQKERGTKKLPGYILHYSFPDPVKLSDWGKESALLIQPWKFMNRVIELWQDNLELLEQNLSFPWAKIF